MKNESLSNRCESIFLSLRSYRCKEMVDSISVKRMVTVPMILMNVGQWHYAFIARQSFPMTLYVMKMCR
jgi:hypothetical protein